MDVARKRFSFIFCEVWFSRRVHLGYLSWVTGRPCTGRCFGLNVWSATILFAHRMRSREAALLNADPLKTRPISIAPAQHNASGQVLCTAWRCGGSLRREPPLVPCARPHRAAAPWPRSASPAQGRPVSETAPARRPPRHHRPRRQD
jgi:hypothetical protein